MRNALKVSAISLAALLAVGCSTNEHQHQQTEARMSATESSIARAQARADEAYRMAEEAMAHPTGSVCRSSASTYFIMPLARSEVPMVTPLSTVRGCGRLDKKRLRVALNGSVL